jgi:hypothetical protein
MYVIPTLPLLTIDPARLPRLKAALATAFDAPDNLVVGIRADAAPVGSIDIRHLQYRHDGFLCFDLSKDLDEDVNISTSRLMMDNLNSPVFKALIKKALATVRSSADRPYWALYLRHGIFLYPKALKGEDFLAQKAKDVLAHSCCLMSWKRDSHHAQIQELADIAPLARWLTEDILRMEGAARFEVRSVSDAH